MNGAGGEALGYFPPLTQRGKKGLHCHHSSLALHAWDIRDSRAELNQRELMEKSSRNFLPGNHSKKSGVFYARLVAK